MVEHFFLPRNKQLLSPLMLFFLLRLKSLFSIFRLLFRLADPMI